MKVLKMVSLVLNVVSIALSVFTIVYILVKRGKAEGK